MDRRSGADVQSRHSGLDHVLRSLLQIGTLPGAALSGPAPRVLGHGEIQTLEAASPASWALDSQGCLAGSRALCSLAIAASSGGWTIRAGGAETFTSGSVSAWG